MEIVPLADEGVVRLHLHGDVEVAGAAIPRGVSLAGHTEARAVPHPGGRTHDN
jgi:hypothetical protein